MRHAVGSPEYKQITNVLKAVERLHRITAQLPLEDTDRANPEAPEDTARPSTSLTRASHSHGQRAAPHQAPHQVISRLGPPPPPHASPALEFLPPPHASSSPEIPPRTAYVVPDLETSLPTADASSHLEIPSHTPRTFLTPLIFHLPPHPLISAMISVKPLLSCTLNPPHIALVI